MASWFQNALRIFLLLALTFGFVLASDEADDGKPAAKQGYGHAPQYQSVSYYGGYGQPYYPPWFPPSPPIKAPKRKMSPIIILMIWLLSRSNQATTTAAPTTTPDLCYWASWSACTATCGGTRSRTRTCSGTLDTQNEGCNTETSFSAAGWYRAANCYEYAWRVGSFDRDEAVTECAGLNGKLAAIGMRDDTIRGDVLTKLAGSIGVGAADAFIGVNDETTADTYVWSDGTTEMPTFWASGQPSGTDRCARVSIGDPFSLTKASCTTGINFLCERKA